MGKINLSEVPDSVNAYIPRQVCSLIIQDVECRLSQAKNPMRVVTAEILQPEVIVAKDENGVDKKINIAGKTVVHYVTYGEKALSMAKDFHNKLGLPLDMDPADKDEAAKWKGVAFDAEVVTEKVVSKDEQTGNVVIDPVTKQELVYLRYKLGTVLRRNAQLTTAIPY